MGGASPQPLPKGRLHENVVWLTSLQALNYLLPMATVPYLIRILGPNNYGVMSFAVTFTQYLVVLTDYGFNLSATRKIAIIRNDRSAVEETMSAVLVIKAVLLVVSLILMACVLLSSSKYSQYSSITAIAFLSVVGTVLFPVWLFQGLQDMRVVTVLSGLGRFVCTGAIFLTVHKSSDVRLATLWTVAGIPISGVAAWFTIHRRYHLVLRRPSRAAVKEAIQSGFHVFISSAMGNVLINGAVLVLGFTSPMSVVGVYAAIEKIAKAAVMLFAPITQALYPRTVEHFGSNYEDGKRFVLRSGAVVIGLAVMVSGGLILGSKLAIALVCGAGFEQYYLVLRVLAIWLLLGVLNNILGIQYLLGSGRYRLYSGCFTISAAATFFLLFILIPMRSYMGAALAVTLGELLLTLLMAVAIYKEMQSHGRPEEAR